jgi:hypothetical protein
MGMERTIVLTGSVPSWNQIQKRLLEQGIPSALRMIDGLPAFPDEVPEDGWRELRISTPSGMMTLRLQDAQLSIVVWGNADDNLTKEWEIVTAICQELSEKPTDVP